MTDDEIVVIDDPDAARQTVIAGSLSLEDLDALHGVARLEGDHDLAVQCGIVKNPDKYGPETVAQACRACADAVALRQALEDAPTITRVVNVDRLNDA
jgi:hypothetical protein